MDVHIPDVELFRGLERVINPPSVRERLLDKNTLAAIRHLNLNSRKIEDLSGIEWCRNVEVLYLAHNAIQNISPLEHLSKLRLLDLSGNPHIRWTGMSKPLLSVEQLFLRSCELQNDLILQMFPNVRQVSLFHNKLEQIEYLYDLKHLESVDLLHNPIPVDEKEIFYNQTGVGVMEKKHV